MAELANLLNRIMSDAPGWEHSSILPLQRRASPAPAVIGTDESGVAHEFHEPAVALGVPEVVTAPVRSLINSADILEHGQIPNVEDYMPFLIGSSLRTLAGGSRAARSVMYSSGAKPPPSGGINRRTFLKGTAATVAAAATKKPTGLLNALTAPVEAAASGVHPSVIDLWNVMKETDPGADWAAMPETLGEIHHFHSNALKSAASPGEAAAHQEVLDKIKDLHDFHANTADDVEFGQGDEFGKLTEDSVNRVNDIEAASRRASTIMPPGAVEKALPEQPGETNVQRILRKIEYTPSQEDIFEYSPAELERMYGLTVDEAKELYNILETPSQTWTDNLQASNDRQFTAADKAWQKLGYIRGPDETWYPPGHPDIPQSLPAPQGIANNQPPPASKHEDTFLDWTKPIRKQSDYVKSILQDKLDYSDEDMRGKDIHDHLMEEAQEKAPGNEDQWVTQQLQQAGINGIRYKLKGNNYNDVPFKPLVPTINPATIANEHRLDVETAERQGAQEGGAYQPSTAVKAYQSVAPTVNPATLAREHDADVSQIFNDALKAQVHKLGVVAGAKDPLIHGYHGSPHKFDAFDINKIGTGQGAQTYGHGLYFAENEKTALDYYNTFKRSVPEQHEFAAGQDENLSFPGSNTGQPNWQPLNDLLGRTGWSSDPKTQVDVMNSIRGLDPGRADHEPSILPLDEVLEHLHGALRYLADTADTGGRKFLMPNDTQDPATFRSALNAAAELTKLRNAGYTHVGHRPAPAKASMYHVAINAHPDTFLDWDKPYSEQSPIVKQIPEWDHLGEHETGSDLHNHLMEQAEEDEDGREGVRGEEAQWVTKQLQKLGINGIKYLDQGSRDLEPILHFGDTPAHEKFPNAYEMYTNNGDWKTIFDFTPEELAHIQMLEHMRGINTYKPGGKRDGQLADDIQDAVDQLEANVKFAKEGTRPQGQVYVPELPPDPHGTDDFPPLNLDPRTEGHYQSALDWLRANQHHYSVKTPPQTHNYVLFDPRHIEIMRRYAIPAAVGATGLLNSQKDKN